MTLRRLAFAAALPAVALAAFLGGTLTEPPANATAVPLLTGTGRLVVAPGLVEPAAEEREIAAEVRGRLKAVLVEEGEPVRAGQLLAEIENADIVAQIAAAEAAVQLREGELARLRAGARPQERREAQAALAESEAALALARQDLERRRPLVEKGFASRELLDQTRSHLAGAEARRNRAAERAALIEAPPRDEDVTIAEAQLAAAQASLAETRARLEKTRLRAPIDGVVLQRHKRTGETVGDLTPTPILRLGDLDRLRVRADIDETDVARVAVGQKVWVSADAYGTQRFAGTVARLGSRLGRKNLRTDMPTEKLDTKVLETLVDLEPGTRLPVGLRVDVFVRP